MKNFHDVFKSEWALYRCDRHEPSRQKLSFVRFGTRFDGGVKRGEIRLFADAVPPRMAFVRESDGPECWQVVPISEFTVPANDGEALVGNRVYQFWNSQPLPKPLVARSWIVDVVNDEECDEIDTFYQHAIDGAVLPRSLQRRLGPKIEGVDLTQLEYEKEFVISESSFDYKIEEPVVVDPPVFARIPLPIAAATDDATQTCIICNEEYFSCELDQKFVSLRRDSDPGTLVFSWKGEMPAKWRVGRNVRVTLHDRISHRQIGEGRISLANREIVIDRFDGLEGLQNPVRKACDAVIVLSRRLKKKRLSDVQALR